MCSSGAFCLLQLSLSREAFTCHSSSLLRDAGTALQQTVGESLEAAQLHMQDVLCMRAYYCGDVLSEEEAAGMVIDGFPPELGDGNEQEHARWHSGPALVPVVAVGGTPAVDAALHIVAIVLRT